MRVQNGLIGAVVGSLLLALVAGCGGAPGDEAREQNIAAPTATTGDAQRRPSARVEISGGTSPRDQAATEMGGVIVCDTCAAPAPRKEAAVGMGGVISCDTCAQ